MGQTPIDCRPQKSLIYWQDHWMQLKTKKLESKVWLSKRMKQAYKTLTIPLLLLVLISSLCLPAYSTKLAAEPLPHRSDSWADSSQHIAPAVSRFYSPEQAQRRSGNAPNTKSAADDHKKNKSQKSEESEEEAKIKAQQDQVKAEKLRLQEATAANNKGVQLGQAGKFQESITAHEQAVQLDPENKQFRINLSAAECAYGQKLLINHNLAGAAGLFRRSLVAASDNGMASRLLSETLKKMGFNPSSADDRLTIADDLLTRGDLTGAGIEYQAAEELEQSARTFMKMGDYAYRLGQADLAASWYQQAITKDIDCGAAYRQLGYISVARGDQTSAASLLRKAVILDSKDTAAGQTLVDLWRKQVAGNPQIAENHLGLAGALQITGDLDGAQAEYGKVAALDPHNPALAAADASLKRAYQHAEAQKRKEAADTLWEQGLKQEALAEIGQAVRLEPTNAKYQLFLGQCLESVGNWQAAHQAYLTCVLIDPENNKEAAIRLKNLELSQQQAQEKTAIDNGGLNPSQQSISQTTGSAVNVPAKTSNTMLEQLSSLEAAHNYDAAINVLRQIVGNNLENPAMHHRLAVNLMSAGEIGEAIAEFRIASALSPAQKDYADDLAQALAINKKALGDEKKE
jgi:tetratricopeptide (TPR) repeat protein